VTATALLRDTASGLYHLVLDGRWAEACTQYERGLGSEGKQDEGQKLYYAIALIRSGRISSGVNLLTPEAVGNPEARIALRRHAIAWLVKEKRIEAAVAVLGLLLEADPASIDDLRLRASLLGRTRQYGAAIADLKRLIGLRPRDDQAQASYLQLLLQDGQVAEAGAHARALGDAAADDPRLVSIALLALSRAKHSSDATKLAELAESLWVADADAAQAIVRTYWEAGRADAAVAVGEGCLAAGSDGVKLRQLLGHAYRSASQLDRLDRSIEHLGEVARQLPTNANSQVLLGEALMRSGRYLEAAPALERACKQLPNAANARALLARALKQAGRHEEAAREFRRLLELQPESHRWHRYAAGALSQAGQVAEAVELFDKFVAKRAQALPDSFEEGLEALWDKAESTDLPAARLDWAWGLRRDRDTERGEWERAARWGYLADHYILDWLECRDDLAHEAMLRLADLSEVDRVVSAVDKRKGLILASAHIGPMYAGPMALELLGVRSKWLASTPGVARTAYAQSLISTSDQSGAEVARKVLSSLHGGNAVVIAVDGAINMAAPRIEFEGQEVTYSDFAARMAHRLGIPSMFVAPRWENGRIHFVLDRMPDPLAGENADRHAVRWRDAYLASLRTYLGGAPENLRLSGGLWRYIREPRERHG
jgi:tetratricopeptide (TPR) repeat protein